MHVTKNELKQIIEEELAAVAESAFRTGGQELNRIRLNTANEVAIALANLAEDLQNMGYGPEAMQLRSWAEANDFLYDPGEEELAESMDPPPGSEAEARKYGCKKGTVYVNPRIGRVCGEKFDWEAYDDAQRGGQATKAYPHGGISRAPGSFPEE